MLITIPLLSRLDMQIDRNMIIYSIIRVCIQTHNNCNMVIRVRTNHFQHTKNYQRARRLRSPTCKYFLFMHQSVDHTLLNGLSIQGVTVSIYVQSSKTQSSVVGTVSHHTSINTPQAPYQAMVYRIMCTTHLIFTFGEASVNNIYCARAQQMHTVCKDSESTTCQGVIAQKVLRIYPFTSECTAQSKFQINNNLQKRIMHPEQRIQVPKGRESVAKHALLYPTLIC